MKFYKGLPVYEVNEDEFRRDLAKANETGNFEEFDAKYGSDDDDDIPEGCRACGGPYPGCKDSCPVFDD